MQCIPKLGFQVLTTLFQSTQFHIQHYSKLWKNVCVTQSQNVPLSCLSRPLADQLAEAAYRDILGLSYAHTFSAEWSTADRGCTIILETRVDVGISYITIGFFVQLRSTNQVLVPLRDCPRQCICLTEYIILQFNPNLFKYRGLPWRLQSCHDSYIPYIKCNKLIVCITFCLLLHSNIYIALISQKMIKKNEN